MPTLVAPRLVISDERGERIVDLTKPRLAIGRNADTDLQVCGATVSRVHAEIVAEGEAYVLYDTTSRFGTYVNGERTAKRQLQNGDQIRLGSSDDAWITFYLVEPAREAAKVETTAISAATELRYVGALLEGLRALGSGRVVDEVLALVLDAAIAVTGAERGFIMLANRDRQLDFKLARAKGKVTLPGQTFATSRKIPEAVFASGKPSIVTDLAEQDREEHAGTIALGIRHVLCMPLRLVRYVEHATDRGADELIGVLYLDSRQAGALSSASTLSALDTLSAEAALAIENARLYREALDKANVEQELKLAADIQQALLPAGPHDGRFYQSYGACQPCRAVGGDFFDYVDLPGGRFGFIVGDVAGKGPPAALLATAALGMFSVEASYQTSAAAVMTHLNLGLFRRGIESRHMTSFYGILAPSGEFLYSNAGHNAPLLLTGGGIRRLETGGSALGLFDQADFEEETVKLERGDMIVAFSDGVTEALNAADEQFRDERLLQAATRHKGESPQVMLAGLLSDLHAFSGDRTQHDDITIVAIRFTG